MSASTYLYLPPTVRVDDFVDMLAVAVGAVPYRRDFVSYQWNFKHHSGWSTEVDHDIKIEASHTPSMIHIRGTVEGSEVWGTWHWEPSDSYPIYGCRVFITSHNEARTPVFEALAKLFGGALSSDLDEGDARIWENPIKYRCDASDGDAWEAWQTAKLNFRGPSTVKWNH